MVATSPNLIQIKRAVDTAQPSSLANGELAWSKSANTLYIGNYGYVVPIGGGQNPGTLTANQALVANSTSFINSVKAGNVTITGMLTANGSSGSAGQILYSDGTGKSYWGSIDTGVPATYVQNTDSRTLSGNLTLSGTYTNVFNLYSGNVYATSLTSGRVTFAGTNGKLSDSTNLSYDNSTQVLSVGAGGVTIGGDTGVGTVSAANGTFTRGLFGTVGRQESITSNTTATFFTGTSWFANNAAYLGGTVASDYALKSYADTAFANASIKADNAFANSISQSKTYVDNQTFALSSRTSGDYVASITAGDGIDSIGASSHGSTPTITVKAGTGVTVGGSGVSIGQDVSTTSDVTFKDITVRNATINGNTALGDTSTDIVTFNGKVGTNILPTNINSYNLGSASAAWDTVYARDVSVGNVHLTATNSVVTVMGGLTVNTSLIANSATFYHNVLIGGDLSLTGNIVYSNVATYIVTDPLVQYAANNNLTDFLDIGFFGNYGTDGNPANHKHTGLFRDASDGVWKFFTNLDAAPTSTVDTADGSYMEATLKAYLDSGALISNSTVLNITGTNSTRVEFTANAITSNTLTLGVALATGSGGTGYNTYSAGDLLAGTGGGSLATLSIGTQGQILQVAAGGTSLIYGGLDGGTF